MISSLNIGIDTDGVLLAFWNDIMGRALKHFHKIKNDIIIDGYTINDILLFERSKCEEYLLKYIEKYCELTNEVIDISKFEIKDIFECSDHDRQMFWIKNITDYCIHSKFIDESIEMIKKWRLEGKKVYNITSREFVTKDNFIGALFRHILNKRYQDEGITFDGIYYSSEKETQNSKEIICNALQIDIMIEDFIGNVESISKSRQVLCFDAPHNKMCSGENITRVKNYREADNFIEDFENNRIEKLKYKSYMYEIDLDETKLSKEALIEYYKQRKNYYRYFYNYDSKYNSVLNSNIKHSSMKLLNKEKLPYQNNIGEIFVTNEEDMKKQMIIASSLYKRNVYISNQLFEDKKYVLCKNINLVSKGESILITRETAPLIAKITGSPIIPLISDAKNIEVGEAMIVRRSEDLEQVSKELSIVLSSNIIKSKKKVLTHR